MPPSTPRNFLILICLGPDCEASIRVRRGDLPEKCYICLEHHGWRVAVDGELTKADRKLLRGLCIRAE